MSPSSFDDELAAAAAKVQAQDDQDRMRAETERQSEEVERAAEAVRAVAWNELLEVGRECAARLRQAKVKPKSRIFSWQRVGTMRNPFIFANTHYKGWQLHIGIRDNPYLSSHLLILREDGMIGWALGVDTPSVRGIPVNFPHPVPPQSVGRPLFDHAICFDDGKIVVHMDEHVHEDKSVMHTFDVREALLMGTAKLLQP